MTETYTTAIIRTGANTKWLNTKDWKDNEKNPRHNTKGAENGFHNTKKLPIPTPPPRTSLKEFFVAIPDVTYVLREI